jgi:3-hydroxy-3-methylglutaryl CoA synthase/uncharacterized OB-fold protein
MERGIPLSWRGQQARYLLLSSICEVCGTEYNPPRDLCRVDGRKGKIRCQHNIRKGKVHSFSDKVTFFHRRKHIFPGEVEVNGKTMATEFTDLKNNGEIKIGDTVEPTFRICDMPPTPHGIIEYATIFKKYLFYDEMKQMIPINAIFVGSENHPYAVKSSACTVAEALMQIPYVNVFDAECACTAAVNVIPLVIGSIQGGVMDTGMVIGADNAVPEKDPGDPLDFSVGTSATAMIFGKDQEGKVGLIGIGSCVPKYRIKVEEVAEVNEINYSDVKKLGITEKAVTNDDQDVITLSVDAARYALNTVKMGDGHPNIIASVIKNGMASFSTDTPDFFRREGCHFPVHGGRFTGEDAYFKHVVGSAKKVMDRLGLEGKDVDRFAPHGPNVAFIEKATKKLGIPDEAIVFTREVVSQVGNSYSGSSPLSLHFNLNKMKEGELILLTGYGSGASSTTIALRIEKGIKDFQKLVNHLQIQLNNKEYVNYYVYRTSKNKLYIY